MRRALVLMTFAICSGLALIGLLGLAIAWFGEVHALVPPARPICGERALRRDHIDDGTFMLFWRDGWLSLISEVATIRPGSSDRHLMDIQLVRCFKIKQWLGCL